MEEQLWDRDFWLLVEKGNIVQGERGGDVGRNATSFAGLGVLNDKGASTSVVREVVCLVFLVLIQSVGAGGCAGA